MTTLRIVARNPNPTLTLRLAPPLRVVSNHERIEHAAMDRDERACFEKEKAELTRGGGLISRRFEWCKNWRDILEEWDEIMWVLPPKDPPPPPTWKELIEEERRYREKLTKVRAKKGRMPTHDECLEAALAVVAERVLNTSH